MDKRNEFAEILYNAQYTSVDEPIIAEKALSTIATWIKSNIPEKLYRYRSVSDNSISAFRDDKIWASIPSTFNDSFECMPCFDHERAKTVIENDFNSDGFKFKIGTIMQGSIPPGLEAIIPPNDIDSVIKNINLTIRELGIEQTSIKAKNIFSAILELRMEEYASDFYSSTAGLMRHYMVACFSETNTSALMWGHYAQSHRGFCLEYDFKPIVGGCTRKCNDILQCNNLMLNYALAPIIYALYTHISDLMQRKAILQWY